jgi:hypothetical protein
MLQRRYCKQAKRNKYEKRGRICVLLDVAMPADTSDTQKEAEKNSKYKSVRREIEQTWNMKWMSIPIIIGATRIVTKGLKKKSVFIPGKNSIDTRQKTAMRGTSHIIRKVLQSEALNLNAWDNRWFKRSTREKWPVTREKEIIILLLLIIIISPLLLFFRLCLHLSATVHSVVFHNFYYSVRARFRQRFVFVKLPLGLCMA